jgi:ankyrin repeat protein
MNMSPTVRTRRDLAYTGNGSLLTWYLDFASESVANNDKTPSSTTSFRAVAPAPAGSSVHLKFSEAVRDGQHRTRLERLLAQGADIDETDGLDLTPLHYAAFRGDLETVRFLLDHGADTNIQHGYLGTPVSIAALRNHADVAKLMLERGADTSISTRHLGTALHCACFSGSIATVKSILSREPEGQEAVVSLGVMSMISDPNLETHKLATLLKPESLSVEQEVRCSHVSMAADRCHFDVLGLLMDSSRILDTAGNTSKQSRSSKSHENPLTEPWSLVDRHTVEIKRRFNEHPRNESNKSYASTSSAWSTLGFPLAAQTLAPPKPTLLMWAAASMKPDLIEYLLEAGASVEAKDHKGRTAVHYAASPFEDADLRNACSSIQRLVNAGATMTVASCALGTSTPETPLMLAAKADHAALDPRNSFKWGSDIHSRCLAVILDHIVPAHEKSKASCNALLSIVSYEVYPAKSIELLCKNAEATEGDASQHAVARRCFTIALHQALRGSASSAVVSILLDHGADPNDCSTSHSLPLTTAVLRKVTPDIVSVLLDYGADPNKLDFVQRWKGDTPHKIAVRLERQDLIELFARVSSQSTRMTCTTNECTEPVTNQSTPAKANEPSVPDEGQDAKCVARAAPKDSRRTWFVGLSALPLPRLWKYYGTE